MGAWRRTPLALQVQPSARIGSPGPRPHAPVGSLSSRHSHVYRQRDSHPWETRVPRRRTCPGLGSGRPPSLSGQTAAPRFTSEPWVGGSRGSRRSAALPAALGGAAGPSARGRAPAPVLAASGPCGRYSSGRFYSCGGALHSRRVWRRSPRPPTRPAAFGGRSLGASARVCWCSGSFSSPHVNVSSFISSVSQV